MYHLSKCHRGLIYVTFLYCNFWMGACYSLQAPFFPSEAKKKGASATQYGWIIGIYSITIAFVAPLSSKLIIYIHPAVLCYGSVFTYAWCTILFGMLEWSPPGIEFIILCILCRILEAISYCIFFTSSNSLIVEIFPENRILLVSIMETVYAVSMTMGPVMGGLLYQLGGYFLPFVVTGFIILIGAVLSFATIRSLDPNITTISGRMCTLLLNFSFMTNLIVCGSSYFGVGFNTATLEPHVRQFHLSPTMVSVFFVAYSFMYSMSSPIWGWLNDKKGHEQLLITIGMTLSLFGYLLIGPVPFIPLKETIYSIIIAQMLLGIGSASQLFSCFSYMMKDAIQRGFPDDIITYTMIIGATLSSASIGEFISPVLGGFLLDHVGYHSATLYIAGIHFAVGIIFLSGILWKRLHVKTKIFKEEELRLTSPEIKTY